MSEPISCPPLTSFRTLCSNHSLQSLVVGFERVLDIKRGCLCSQCSESSHNMMMQRQEEAPVAGGHPKISGREGDV